MSQWQARNEITERDDFLDLLAWVRASEKRVEIITSLVDSSMNSTDFAEAWGVTTEAVQYHLKLLRQGGPDKSFPPLVQVETPERERYRLWGLTEAGQSLANQLENGEKSFSR